MHSPTPGLIAQMDGWLNKKRYRYAAIFVDHYSGYGFVHLQKTQSAEETLQGKAAFERHSQLYGVKILHYHSGTGIFASKPWKDACKEQKQSYSYSGVNAHFQSISPNFWPNAVVTGSDVYNEAPTTKL
jgi:hypothetical protein